VRLSEWISGRLPKRITAAIPRLPAICLILIALLGCGEGYETRTKRGDGVKEWFLRLGEGKVEAMAVWPPGDGRRPALLLVHAATERAQRFRRAMFDLSRQGVVAMSISLPGFGGSTGPEDFAGPRSVEAVLEAARYLASRRDVSGIAVYGYGQGATTALIAAIRGKNIRLVAVEGGVYGLGRAYPDLPPAERERLRFLLGGGPGEKPAAYRMRSPIHEAGRLRGPALIIHSRDEKRYPLSESERLADALKKKGLPHRFIPTRGKLSEFSLGHASIRRWVLPFVRKYLGGNAANRGK
jgi:dipeptidyl aminopeptidase/acylaminoacyl peptidase